MRDLMSDGQVQPLERLPDASLVGPEEIYRAVHREGCT